MAESDNRTVMENAEKVIGSDLNNNRRDAQENG
jgi:hypothetical protein